MKKSQRLKSIVDLNAKTEKQALIGLGEAQKKKQQADQQLEHLQSYLQEYKDKYQSISEVGVNISQLLEFRAFINKLELALEEQNQVVLEMEKELDFARRNWENKHQKTNSLQKVCDSALLEEQKDEMKREQNEQDDRGSRNGRGSGTRNA